MVTTKRVSISDIARIADVSIGTVSNYLNYPDRVSPALSKRVSAVIAELGYEPRKPPRLHMQGSGQAERSGVASSLVGFVMTDIEHSLFTHIFEGIQEVCEDRNMQVLGANAFSDKDRQSDLIETFIRLDVSGILLSTVTDPVEDIAKVRHAHKPIVLLDHSSPTGACAVCSVMENNVSVGQLAAQELIETGCKKILFAAHLFDYESIQNRQLGVQRAVEAAKSAVQFSTFDAGGLLFEDGYQLGSQISDMPADERPDGIVTGGDALAAGLIENFTERGIQVPDDISIVGCEGIRLPMRSRMPLTVVNAPANDMGEQAMTHLIDELENPETHVHMTTLVDPKLVRRASTRPNPNASK
ncbi:LacI family DNA-binding transcriptional regulator [Bifidobacterium sp. ESL0800]|uniref:LacI family DNA-binding transcriptional regulator n=1 Tax=Bifidobacterium sp. ESL0800 TaxID=2983236 RepID=UPI0023F9FD41|nr:LacI family DNA-binding transcriptional regulator [Bifidobacterium sp. ESL0800]WEV75310.1 LacI family DNA-binding transcriptional regulator [Bifidobacterium sp. ESL0800]